MSEQIGVYLGEVAAERRRQLKQGKAEDNDNLVWHLVVADQLALITRTLSLTRYAGVKTRVSELTIDAVDREGIKLGLVRLGACAAAWYEALDREEDR